MKHNTQITSTPESLQNGARGLKRGDLTVVYGSPGAQGLKRGDLTVLYGWPRGKSFDMGSGS